MDRQVCSGNGVHSDLEKFGSSVADQVPQLKFILKVEKDYLGRYPKSITGYPIIIASFWSLSWENEWKFKALSLLAWDTLVLIILCAFPQNWIISMWVSMQHWEVQLVKSSSKSSYLKRLYISESGGDKKHRNWKYFEQLDSRTRVSSWKRISW